MARHYNSNRGFTLIEMLTVVLITGIFAAIAWPFLAKDKRFTNTIPQIESTLKIVSLKARANSGNPYRVTLQANGGEQFLKVDYLLSNNCTPTNTATWESAAWRQDPAQTLYLPTTVTVSNFPVKGFCFNGKGESVLSPGTAAGTPKSFDVSANNSNSSAKAVKATISISAIGDISRRTYDKYNNEITGGKFN
jgi:prepilin-type N-terminal cleavage/methylation domain-containing protein